MTRVAPRNLRDSVYTAVHEGAWSVSDVVATVTSEMDAARCDVVAVLWDLAAEGVLSYDTIACHFRPAVPALVH
ncbi:hypothetical protein [Nocardioides ferulae]|uniref:hypothetical protein n=1 Tax=Nocardioides ferulae TaxID=2340821 RepID=UPI000EB5B443|nr:hypothetical protein [Nocardioides ferulae]